MTIGQTNRIFSGDDQRSGMLAAIIDSSEDAIISKNLNGIITSWNKSAERLFGYSEEEAIGKSISILIPPYKLSEEDTIIALLKAGKRIEHYETIRLTKSGRLIPISLTISPIRNAEGVIIGASKIARDITMQKQAEEMTRRYTRHLELINSTSRALAAQVEEEAILQIVTDVSTELTGAAFGAFFYNKTDARGESYTLYALSGAPREAFEKLGMPRNTEVFAQTFNGDSILRSDDITKDPRYGKNAPHKGMPEGHLPVVSYLAVPVTSQIGVVIGGLFFGHPEPGKFVEEHEKLVLAIAAQGAICLEKAKLYEEIKSLNAKKDEFIGFASHELKTPVTTISGYLQLAEQFPDMSTDILPKINRQITRLAGLIADLLDISKIHTSGLELNYTRVTLSSLIREAVETVRTLGSVHKISYDIPVEEITLHVDAQKIVQVLINLLNNAIKYSNKDTEVHVTALLFGDQIQFAVSDQGIGIPSNELDKIFNRFYRVSYSPNNPKGMGLGLYLCREIIEVHRGKIWAESELKKGSTFYFTVPIDPASPIDNS